MTKRKFSDLEGCSTWEYREIIVIPDSDDELETIHGTEEPVYRDIYEVPPVAAPVVAEPMEDEDEDPEEDPEWDAEAAAYDAMIEETEMQAEGQYMEVEGADAEVPIWDAPEPMYDPAWDEPAPGSEDIAGGGIADLEHPAYDIDAAMVVDIVQAAAAEVQAVTDAAAADRQAYEAELATTRALLAAEQRRTARLTTALDMAGVVMDSTQARLDQVRVECTTAFMDLTDMIHEYPHYLDQPFHTIDRQVVLHMVDSTAIRILGRIL